MFPIDNIFLISIPLTEIAAFIVGEPLGTGLGSLFSTSAAERGSIIAHFPPFTHKAIIICSRKALPGLGHFLKRFTLSKRLQHGFTQPIHNRRAGNLREVVLINSVLLIFAIKEKLSNLFNRTNFNMPIKETTIISSSTIYLSILTNKSDTAKIRFRKSLSLDPRKKRDIACQEAKLVILRMKRASAKMANQLIPSILVSP